MNTNPDLGNSWKGRAALYITQNQLQHPQLKSIECQDEIKNNPIYKQFIDR
jgi:hypothetical protein